MEFKFRICQNVQNKHLFRKLWKYCKSHKHSVRNVGNDDLNYVCYSWHDAPHRSWNFEYAKMCKTNSNFEKFQNTVNLRYTLCAMLEMIIWTTFTIASMVRMSAAWWEWAQFKFRISQYVQNKQPFRKLCKYCKCHMHSVRNVGNQDLNYVCYS